MDATVYQHFRKEEAPFIDNVSEWMERANMEYRPILTDFLDPRQQFIVEDIVGKHGIVHYFFNGGYGAAERRRGIIAPEYFTPEQDDFAVQLFNIKYPQKFATLRHSQILGTLVNSGLKRDAFGDIMTDGVNWQFFTEASLADYVQNEITKVGKINVQLEPADYTALITPKDAWAPESATVSSLRLDTLISEVYHMSRQRAKGLIEGDKVKLNWETFAKPDFTVGLMDVVSVPGFGRIQITDLAGQTKKGRIKLAVNVLRK